MALELNERQRQAIEHVHGPMLVIAGAGTGKTTVLVNRIARLISNGHARPNEILAITYTENAADEMHRRVSELVGADCDLRACTFHAYCLGLLERCGRAFRVIDEKDLWVYLRCRIEELPLELFRPARNPAEFLDALLAFFARCHDELITPAKYEAYVARLREGVAPLPRVSRTSQAEELSRDDVLARCDEIAKVFRKVEDMLRADNLGTFGHMITDAVALLRGDSELLAKERARARFILIDEFQDANVSQIELAALLAGDAANVFAVGDPDQAIYRFRGASSAAFQEFRRRFPQTKAVVLSENQRSTAKILDASFSVIAKNPDAGCGLDTSGQNFRRERLQSARECRAQMASEALTASPVAIVLAGGAEEEAADVADAIEMLRAEFGDALDCAVLYRLHGHREELARELSARKVPFTVRSLDALETPDLRDATACLEAILAERAGTSVFRVAALPVFGLHGMRVRDELQLAGRSGDMTEVLQKVPGGEKVLTAITEARNRTRATGMNAAAALEIASKCFGLPISPALAALHDFMNAWQQKPITRTKQLDEFLEYLEYFREAGGAVTLPEREAGPGLIKLMTVHSAKGLEFEHVFVLRANSGSFPANYREDLFEFPPELREISQPEVGDRDIHKEEERRLFYVAMTRARDSLAIYAKPGRGKDDTPAGFLRDLMKDRAACATWRKRAANATVTLHAAAHPVSGVGEWLLTEPALALTNITLSATAIGRYRECPLEFKIYREWNIPGAVAAGMQYGNAMHMALKGYYDAIRAGRPQSEAELLTCFCEALAALPFDDVLQRALYEQQGLKQLSEFFAARAMELVPDVIATERSFEIVVGGVRVKGRVDRLDRIEGPRVVLTDYKTGSPRKAKDADESLQLSIYALACREWNFIPDRLVFYNLDGNEAVGTTRTAAQLQETEEEVSEVAAGIESGNFEPKRGFHCRHCAYRSLCPETEQWLV